MTPKRNPLSFLYSALLSPFVRNNYRTFVKNKEKIMETRYVSSLRRAEPQIDLTLYENMTPGPKYRFQVMRTHRQMRELITICSHPIRRMISVKKELLSIILLQRIPK